MPIETIIAWCDQRLKTIDREIALRSDEPVDEYVQKALFRARREEIGAVLELVRELQKNDEMIDSLISGTIRSTTVAIRRHLDDCKATTEEIKP